MNKSTLNNLSDHEFIKYCKNITSRDILEFGNLLREAIDRLESIEMYGCGDCTYCDETIDFSNESEDCSNCEYFVDHAPHKTIIETIVNDFDE